MKLNGRWWSAAAAGIVVGGLAVGYRIGRARADGIAVSTPMYYAGTLEDGGALANGNRNFTLALWDDQASTDMTHQRCVTTAMNTLVTNGRFRIALDNSCTAVIHATPDLWVDVAVGGTSLGRTKLGAVPFAVEAGRAADVTASVRNSLVPAGTIVAFGGTTPPTGWLLCDGATVSRIMYPNLFLAIGTLHGAGDGSATFNLPDYRGRFLRGADNGAMRDPDRSSRTAPNTGGATGDSVGSVQGSAEGNHVHGIGRQILSLASGAMAVNVPAMTTDYFANTGPAGTSTESRPTNAAVNYIIRF